MNRARASDSFAATSWKRTRLAPSAASSRIRPSAAAAAVARDAAPAASGRPRARAPAPAAARGRSSHGAGTRSWSRAAGERGTTSPLQSGQCAPQPAPEPVARTKAPHRITARFQARTSQAKRASRVMAGSRAALRLRRTRRRLRRGADLACLEVVVPGELQDQGGDGDDRRAAISSPLNFRITRQIGISTRLVCQAMPDHDVEHVAPEVLVALEGGILLAAPWPGSVPRSPRAAPAGRRPSAPARPRPASAACPRSSRRAR